MSIISKETWDNLIPEEEKEKIRQDYQNIIETKRKISFTNDEISGAKYQMELLFGKENLQPKKPTYEDVARELFKEGAWQPHDYASKYDFDENSEPTYFLNCASEKQAEKLLAINRLLNVAKFLNGKDWKPNEIDGKLWAIGIEKYNKTIMPIEVGVYDYRTEIVYFRTEELAKQAVSILGRDTIILALSNDF